MNVLNRAPARSADRGALLRAAETVAAQARARAARLDDDSTFPLEDVAALSQAGLLVAPFPALFGGLDCASGPEAALLLLPLLRAIGAASLPLGRLYEGHVNAIALVRAYGDLEQMRKMASEAARGGLFGVWAADDAQGLALSGNGPPWVLTGRKILCSGAPFIERPLVTARDDDGRLLMVTPRLNRGERADLSAWTPQGMRASATGSVTLTGLTVGAQEIVGGDDDYHREPMFSGGAWRFAAVQLGGMEALLDELRRRLARTGRGENPHQAARLGQAAIAVETARLWVERAAALAESTNAPAEATVAYVNLARSVVEREALALMELVHRSVGLASFMRPDPLERISRDLATYLRQPGPDRALTSAAAWVLAQDSGLRSLWA